MMWVKVRKRGTDEREVGCGGVGWMLCREGWVDLLRNEYEYKSGFEKRGE